MNFYLDFEATRFSNRIISIGCVAENGATFDTLVKPVNKAKVDKFITELTGITNAMLADAPTADEAFNRLFDFIELNNDDSEPKYYVYGNSDADFLEHTVKYMTDTRACVCAQAIKGSLIDYATTVQKFFTMKNNVALRKVYMVVQSQKECIQKHNALEDAMMLQAVVEHMHDNCKPADKEIIMNIASDRIYKPKLKSAPAIFTNWNNYSKFEAPTNASEDSWVIKAQDQHKGGPMYFNDLDTAALWIIKYVSRNLSPKNQGHIERVKAAIVKGSTDGKCRYNCYWTMKGE
jgi:DNA polymerase III epsilon subunit-like protein